MSVIRGRVERTSAKTEVSSVEDLEVFRRAYRASLDLHRMCLASGLSAVIEAPPTALTIAGSDSGGGAGIQADLKTFAAFGVYGTSAITALTAQNTVSVNGVHAVPAEFVAAQIDAVLDDLDVRAVKTGLLATTPIIETVAGRAGRGELANLVVDPVMVASSGKRLLEPDAEQAYRDRLFRHALVITPNLREAAALLDRPVRSIDDMAQAARDLADTGPRVVVVKGGHLIATWPPSQASQIQRLNDLVGRHLFLQQIGHHLAALHLGLNDIAIDQSQRL